MKYNSDYIGKTLISNSGEKFKIIDYINSGNCTIEFDDGVIIKNLFFNNIIKGKVRNPNSKTTFLHGYTGVGQYSPKTHPKIFKCWSSMFQRCYREEDLEKQPNYKDVDVCAEWGNFQNFAKWYEDNWKPHMEGWHLDKDILVKENKIYSPETCCFVPNELNILFRKTKNKDNLPTGVSKRGNIFKATISKNGKSVYIGYFKTAQEATMAYKKERTLYLLDLAEKWKNKIDLKVYKTLIKTNHE